MKSAEIETPLPFPHHLTTECRVRSGAGFRRLTWVAEVPGVSFKKLSEQGGCVLVEVSL